MIQFFGDPDLDVVDDVYEIQFLGDPDLDVVDDVMRFSFLVNLT